MDEFLEIIIPYITEIKIFLGFGMALAGIVGTVYDFKHDGILTKKGIILISILLLFAITGVILELAIEKDTIKKTKASIEQLKRENDERTLLLKKSDVINNDINKSIETLNSLGGKLSQLSQKQLAQQEKIENSIIILEDKTVRHLNRLSFPLVKMFFSFKLTHEEANKLYPDYYNRIKGILLAGDLPKNNWTYSSDKSDVKPKFDEQKAFRSITDTYQRCCFYIGVKDLNVLLDENKADLIYEAKSWLGEFGPDNYKSFHSDNRFLVPSIGTLQDLEFNFSNGTVTQRISYASTYLQSYSGEVKSILDITQQPDSGNNFLTISYIANDGKSVFLSDVKMHFDESIQNEFQIKICNLEKIDKLKYGQVKYLYICQIN
jgi:uncharacterized protein YoxC